MAKRKRRFNSRSHVGEIPAVQLPVTFESGSGFVTAVIRIDSNTTIGIKFMSPEQLLNFFVQLMEGAEIAWPDDPFVKYYTMSEGVPENEKSI